MNERNAQIIRNARTAQKLVLVVGVLNLIFGGFLLFSYLDGGIFPRRDLISVGIGLVITIGIFISQERRIRNLRQEPMP
ncbi:MAG: hypothetical protein KDE15_03040 [Erythrobacter sp.]|nr:hypothetical protein [Erythrobacter sp.]